MQKSPCFIKDGMEGYIYPDPAVETLTPLRSKNQMKFPRSSGKIRGFGSGFHISGIKRRKMEVYSLRRCEFIKLGQALKLARSGQLGGMKFVIQDGGCKSKWEVETQRGKKSLPGKPVSYGGKTFKVEN